MNLTRRAALAFTANPRIPLTFRRKLALNAIPLDGRDFTVDVDGVPYHGQLDNFIDLMVYATRRYFEYTYINLIRSLVGGGAALDIGANVGNHSHAFSGIFDAVHAFEPYPPVAEKLEAKARQLDNVAVHRVALSDQEGIQRFAPPESINLGVGRIDESGSMEVPVVIADRYLDGRLDQPLNFVKLDVEGHELKALAGLRETLARHRPVAVFEVPKSLPGSWRDNVRAAFACFPERYRFIGLRTQSSFPVQRNVARGVALNRDKPRATGKVAYILAYGEERGFVVAGGRILPSGA